MQQSSSPHRLHLRLYLHQQVVIMVVYCIVLLIVPCGVVASEARPDPQSESVERMDFHQTLLRALEKSPDYDILRKTKNKSDLAFKNSWSVLLPELDLETQNGFNNQGGNSYIAATAPVTPWSSLLGLTLTENLYDNGKALNEMDVAGRTREIGTLSLIRGKQQLLLNVALAYYDYSSTMQSLELQRQEIVALQQQFRTIDGRYRNGVSSNRDFLRIKAQVQRSEIDLTTQQVAAETARQTLRQVIGESSATDFIPIFPKGDEIGTWRAPDITPENTFDFRIARLQDDISDIHFREVEREDWPRLALKGSFSYNVPQYVGAQTPGVDDPYWNVQGMLVMDYALWDWGIRRRNVEVADQQRVIERDTQEKTRLQVRQDLRRLIAQAALYQKSYAESVQILRDEENVYSSLNQGYRDAKVTYLELITALGELFASRTQSMSLQFSLLKARASLAFYEGNLDELLDVR